MNFGTDLVVVVLGACPLIVAALVHRDVRRPLRVAVAGTLVAIAAGIAAHRVLDLAGVSFHTAASPSRRGESVASLGWVAVWGVMIAAAVGSGLGIRWLARRRARLQGPRA